MLLHRSRPAGPRSGAALMLSMLVLMVLVLIVWQIGIGTRTNMMVARNDVTATTMDLAIESAFLEVFEQLKTDAEAAAEAGAAGGGAPMAGAGGTPGGAAGALGGLGGAGGAGEAGASDAEAPSDSRQDEWARPQRTEVNQVPLRILVQDENSKINVLGMLTADEQEAEKAFQRVVRVIDLFREGTKEDIPTFEAQDMAQLIRDTLLRRRESPLPRPRLVTDDPQRPDLGMPLTIREFAGVLPFKESHFRDYRDEDGKVVHSLASFLTLVSSLESLAERNERLSGAPGGAGGTGAGGGDAGPTDGSGGGGGGSAGQGSGGAGSPSGAGSGTLGGSGGQVSGLGTAGGTAGQAAGSGANGGVQMVLGAVNLNTAPAAVLKSLFDDREVPTKFWDEVIEYRNEEVEPEPGLEQEEPPVDEFGEEIIERQIFTNIDQLLELDGWYQLTPEAQADVARMVGVTSDVYTIYVTARRATGRGTEMQFGSLTREDQEKFEESGLNQTRTVRCTIWRRSGEEGVQIVPIERWELVDYRPYEILDFPDDER